MLTGREVPSGEAAGRRGLRGDQRRHRGSGLPPLYDRYAGHPPYRNGFGFRGIAEPKEQ